METSACEERFRGSEVQQLREIKKNSLHNELVSKWESRTPTNVHNSCRKVLMRPIQSLTEEAASVSKRLRSQSYKLNSTPFY